MKKPQERRVEYKRRIFATKQVRDCVNGSDSIKRAGELYLPMPSGMRGVTFSTGSINVKSSNSLADDDALNSISAPWSHGNPAYSAYVQRAKFPDMTANTLDGLLGIAIRDKPEVDLPTQIGYLEEICTIDGRSVFSLYKNCLSEVLQAGRIALVADVRSDNTFYISEYISESYINWDYGVVNGSRVQTYAEFETEHTSPDDKKYVKSLCYYLEPRDEYNGRHVCVVRKFIDGKLDEEVIPVFMGKPLEFIPISNVSAKDSSNYPSLDSIPLLGVSDCAVDIYRHSADLNQNQFMSCNPTLVFYGVDPEDAPTTIGSTIAICISDSSARGEYLATDTSALSHVKDYMQDVFQEAVFYGANLLGPSKKSAESAEALALRQASSGATLNTVVDSVGKGISRIFSLILKAYGVKDTSKDYFIPNTSFADVTLSHNEINSLLNAWMSGGISHMTLLENLADAGRLGDRSPDDELIRISDEVPVVDGVDG
jgi:hypothetical protein